MKYLIPCLLALVASNAHAGQDPGYHRELCKGKLSDGRAVTLDGLTRGSADDTRQGVWIYIFDGQGNKVDTAGSYLPVADEFDSRPGIDGIQLQESPYTNVTQHPVHDSCYVGTEGSYDKSVQVTELRQDATDLKINVGDSFSVHCETYSVMPTKACR